MTPEYAGGNVRARCPDCEGAVTTFEMRSGGSEFGTVPRNGDFEYPPEGAPRQSFPHAAYVLLRCASCGRGGLATVYHPGSVDQGVLVDFYPYSADIAPFPAAVPPTIAADYREAETCASVQAFRGASALLRSVLEKTLRANGYKKGNLAGRIDEAAADGVITAARQRRAHDEVRTLGNDILHDEWRAVTADEYEGAHHYVLRILEDFYDHRAEVESLLREKGRFSNDKDEERQ